MNIISIFFKLILLPYIILVHFINNNLKNIKMIIRNINSDINERIIFIFYY